MNRVEKLQTGYKQTSLSSIKGKRTCKITSLIKTEASPGDTYYVPIPALGPSQCINRDTLSLSHNVENGNTNS